MGENKYLSKRHRRYLGAIIAAGVTTFTAFMLTPSASAQNCTLQDASQWQLALHDAEAEQTPAYVRSVTEAFLNACPSRPEFSEASRVAGIAAVDMQDAESASAHFANAGRMTDILSNFYAMSAYHKAGNTKATWRLRDQIVESWRTRLERHPMVSVSVEPMQDGMLYQLYFSATDRNSGTRAAWVAVPYGPGWPATLSFSQDRMRLALRKARAAKDNDFRYVDLNRCHGRRTLGRIETTMSSSEFDATARASLTAYLANPDLPNSRSTDQIAVCVLPNRLLPGVPKP